MLEADSPDRPNYVAAALKWSAQGDEDHRSGHPDLHQKFAQTLWHGKFHVSDKSAKSLCGFSLGSF